MLKAKMLRHGARCWLVNTGWVGGGFNVGKRISIRHTRALLNAALHGRLDHVEPVVGSGGVDGAYAVGRRQTAARQICGEGDGPDVICNAALIRVYAC